MRQLIPSPTSSFVAEPASAGVAAGSRAWAAMEPQLAAHEPGGTGGGSDVQAAWRWADGSGVRVALLDDGFDASGSGADLDLAASRFFAADGSDVAGPTAVAEGAGLAHGTATAGVLAATGSGPVGVAPGATVVGVKEGFGAATDAAQLAAGLRYAAGTAAVVNNSWEVAAPEAEGASDAAFAPWFAAVAAAVGAGRGGLGAAVVFAAGNGRAAGDDLGLHGISDDPRVIAVAGVEPGGAVAPFSTPGAGLLVAAEATGVLAPAAGGGVAVESGTSFAAPIVSGIIAMMLQANPGLGWRDVQEILADSAYMPRSVGSTDGGTAVSGVVVNAARDWNGGGRAFSDDVGFGVVDALTAVSLARAWTGGGTDATLLRAGATSAGGAQVLGGGAVASSLALGTAMRVEHVQVGLDAPGATLGGLTLVLVSPAGTRSVLLAAPAAGAGVALTADPITSNAFWGEQGAGTWTLLAQDGTGAEHAVLDGWSLTAWGDGAGGTAGGATPLVVTPEFAALAAADPSRTALGGGGATTLIAAGAMTGATILDLNGGAGVLDGVAVTLAPGLTTASFTGDSAPVSVTAPRTGAARLVGGEGPTTLTGGTGADTLVAGAGSTAVSTGAGTSLVDLTGGAAGSSDSAVLNGMDTVLAGAGAVAVRDTGTSGALVFAGAGALSLTGGAGMDTVVGATGPVSVFGAAGGATLFSAGGALLVGGTGATTLVSGGADTVWAAAGGSFFAGAGSALHLSGGHSVVTAGSGSQVWLSGDAGALLVAGAGTVSLDGSAAGGEVVAYAGSGSDMLSGGTAGDVLFLGTGNATLSGGGGGNLFVAVRGAAGGSDVITDFHPGSDHLVLQGYGADAAARTLDAATTVGGTTQLALSDGTRISLLGVHGIGGGDLMVM